MVETVAPVKGFLQAYDDEHRAEPMFNASGHARKSHARALLQRIEENAHKQYAEVRAAFISREAEERAAFAAKEAATHKMVDTDIARFKLSVQKETKTTAAAHAMVKFVAPVKRFLQAYDAEHHAEP